MPAPTIKKFPTEIFGYPFTVTTKDASLAREKQFCPFIQSECKKPRKSDPTTKVGICSVGYKGKVSKEYIPVIICPHRFELNIVHQTIEKLYFHGKSLFWASEIFLGSTLGYIDFVGVDASDNNLQKVNDFIGVEIQAAGTTGTPWDAILEYKKGKHFKKDRYNFGINWANEFAKTMMQQAYKKGWVVERWGKKIVFVIQDVALRYLQKNYDTSDLHAARDTDAIHFCTFRMDWNDDKQKWELKFEENLSTNTEGIRKMLSGNYKDIFPSQEDFLNRFRKKFKNQKLNL